MAGNNPDIASDGMSSGNCIQTVSSSQGAKECSICYQPMTSEENKTPRLLNCGHTFCTECLRRIYDTAADAYAYRRRMEREILCPHCKTPCTVPDGDVLKLPKNYALLEILSEQPKVKTNPDNILCKTHNIVKKSYCFNCQDLVCPYCQMVNHQTHNCQITIEAIKVFMPDFMQNQERLEAYSQQLKSAKDKFQATLYRLKENQREASHHINVRFTAIIEEAQKWKNINMRKLDDMTKEREEILDQQIESLNDVIDETDRKIELAKRITTPQNEEEFFIHHKNIVSETQVLVSKEMGLQPLVHEHIEWRVDPINHIIDLLNRIAFVNEDANAGPVKSPPPSLEAIPASTEIHSQFQQRSSIPPHPSQPSPPIATHTVQSPSGIPTHMHGQSQYPYYAQHQMVQDHVYPETSRGAISSANSVYYSKFTAAQSSMPPSGYPHEGPRSMTERSPSADIPPPINKVVGSHIVHEAAISRPDSSINPPPFSQQTASNIYTNLSAIAYPSHSHKSPEGHTH